jgi:hypothetical protein
MNLTNYVLAIGSLRAVVVISAFENEAEALGHESDLRCFSVNEIKGYVRSYWDMLFKA